MRTYPRKVILRAAPAVIPEEPRAFQPLGGGGAPWV